MAHKTSKIIKIEAQVPAELKAAYTDTWQRLKYASESEFSRHLFRKAIVDNKPLTDK